MGGRAKRPRKRGCLNIGCVVRVAMIAGIAGLVALQIALFSSWSASENELTRIENDGGNPSSQDSSLDKSQDSDGDALGSPDGAYDEGEGLMDSQDTDDGEGAEDDNDDAEDTDDQDIGSGEGSMNIFAQGWMHWMRASLPEKGIRKRGEYVTFSDQDLDRWLAKCESELGEASSNGRRFEKGGGGGDDDDDDDDDDGDSDAGYGGNSRRDKSQSKQRSSDKYTAELASLQRTVLRTLHDFDTSPFRVSIAIQTSVLESTLQDAADNAVIRQAYTNSNGNQQERAHHHVKVVETVDDGTCARWREAIPGGEKLKSAASVVTARAYSIANTVPEQHAALWRRAFETHSKTWVEGTDTSADGDNFHRMLVLPWTLESSLMEVGEQISQRNDPYYLTLTRSAPGPGPSNWALTARRQDLVSKLREYMNGFECPLETLGIVSPVFEVVASQEDCKRLFSSLEDKDQTNSVWLIKGYGVNSCPPGGGGLCVEVPAMTQVVTGLAPLRRQYGHCQSSVATPVLVERAVPSPLLVHSRRFKWHTLVLVASSDPWRTYFHPGYITLATPNARTERDGPTGTTISSMQSLIQETTDLHKQQYFRERGEQEPPLWTFARLLRYFESYGICDRPCKSLTSRVRAITRLLVEATRRGSLRPVPRVSSRFSDFQIIRVDFWVTENLQPILHRGSADVGFLLDDWGSSSEVVRKEMENLIAEAIALAEDPSAPTKEWELLQDEFADLCRGAEPRIFNPCKEIESKPLITRATPKPSLSKLASQQHARNQHLQQQQDSAVGDSGGSSGLGGAAPRVQIIEWDAPKFSPKQPLSMERLSPRIQLDSM